VHFFLENSTKSKNMSTNHITICSFVEITLPEANKYLCLWKHKMGELQRGDQGAICHALLHRETPIAITAASHLIRQNVGGGLTQLTRKNTIELSRLCASRSGLCRVALRMWREFVFPELPFDFAISYQDADLHNGNTYRFDGWRRVGYSHSGTDTRTGRKGRNKWIWIWHEHQKVLNALIAQDSMQNNIPNKATLVDAKKQRG
jgi:antitoxin VapB